MLLKRFGGRILWERSQGMTVRVGEEARLRNQIGIKKTRWRKGNPLVHGECGRIIERLSSSRNERRYAAKGEAVRVSR